MTTECAPITDSPRELGVPQPPGVPPRGSLIKRVFRSFWTRLFLLVFIFTAGGVTGYCVGSILMEQKYVGIINEPRPRTDSLMQHFKTSLELTDAQYADVEKVIRRHHESLEKIRRQVAPMYVAEFDQMDQDMQEVLNDPHQKELWKKKAAGMRLFWEKGRPLGRDRGKRRSDTDQRSGDQRSGNQRNGEQKSSAPKPEDQKTESLKINAVAKPAPQ